MNESFDEPSAEVLNSEVWHEHLEQEVALAEQTGQPLSVAFIDLNNFKAINDTYGHPAGDAFIEDIKTVFSDSAAHFFTVGRLGGDEFGFSGQTTSDGAEEIKQRLRGNFDLYINDPRNAALKDLDVGMAIGLATLQPGMTASELLTQADEAMYVDKLDQVNPTPEQRQAIMEAAVILQKAGLRLRDLPKFEKAIQAAQTQEPESPPAEATEPEPESPI
jgi:diguanylate cyclase (GGDEF)-like protein